MRVLRVVWYLILFSLLTLVTQVGGVIFILALLIRHLIWRKKKQKRRRTLLLAGTFLGVYVVVCFVLLPPLAKLAFEREPLPVFNAQVAPLTIWTAILNRHYVTSTMKEVMEELGEEMTEEFPDHTVLYLDAGFPLFNRFPLPPHLSHNDGQKVDIAFVYQEKETGNFVKEAHTWLGYGGCEVPAAQEWDKPAECEAQGYWQYSLLQRLNGGLDGGIKLDRKRTVRMIQLLAQNRRINKMFLEPHLKTRWGLASAKVRYHGCQAVRHDDHVHIQF